MTDTSGNTKLRHERNVAELSLPTAYLYRKFAKRAFDIIVALLLVPVVFPVIAVLYVIVRLDGGPGFFGHRRVGQDGEMFRCWKLRSMVTDSQERLEHLLKTDPAAREEWDRDHKLRNDPRITRIGDVLRKTSLDELPQLWNVLRGDMSLIGPRPITQVELDRYGGLKWVYLSMRPGISGLWQVSGRNEATYEERIQMDVDYSRMVSLSTDVRIMFKTVGAVLNRTGC